MKDFVEAFIRYTGLKNISLHFQSTKIYDIKK